MPAASLNAISGLLIPWMKNFNINEININFDNIYCSPKKIVINGSIAHAIPVAPIINITKLRKFSFL